MSRLIASLHDRSLCEDERGLTVLAYAMGAAFIVAPLAALLFMFGGSTATDAGTVVDGAITP